MWLCASLSQCPRIKVDRKVLKCAVFSAEPQAFKIDSPGASHIFFCLFLFFGLKIQFLLLGIYRLIAICPY